MDALKKCILHRNQKEIGAEERKKSSSASSASRPVLHTSRLASPPPTQSSCMWTEERMDVIWDTQRCHLPHIQDPPGVQLYTQTVSVTKGGLTLPVYRCAWGSKSLESFYNHLNRIIPAGKVKWGVSTNCWTAILHDNQAIRRLVGNYPALRGQTRIQLFEVNQQTLSVWYNNYRKKMEADVLALSVPLPHISMVSDTNLPVARQMKSMPSAPGSSLQRFPYVESTQHGSDLLLLHQHPLSPPHWQHPSLLQRLLPSLLHGQHLSAPAAGTSMSRTTLWRKRKAQELLAQEQGLPCPQPPVRKAPGWAASTSVPQQQIN
ncbi:cyclin-dependent kinase inhibitor 1C-like protein [Labeo rohita]|uniref:Cyclin-dependent kinase inhibitor 1C-like protein n=1 Tax=Labeo rohita TaxID=84645 RepID=A0A498NWH0_LABRO|nr:cyclin-dependent kinase inhibitor 1C-like protein [Labeo rohita]